MRIVLQKDVAGLGKTGEIKKVADGYARHYLIPGKLAKMATENVIKSTERNKEWLASKLKSQHHRINKLGDNLKNRKINVKAKANKIGKLFGAISIGEIIDSINKQLGVQIDPSRVIITKPIKAVGEHPVLIKFPDDITVKVVVVVTAF